MIGIDGSGVFAFRDSNRILGIIKGLQGGKVSSRFTARQRLVGPAEFSADRSVADYGDTQKQVSQFPVRHCEFRTGLRPVPLDETTRSRVMPANAGIQNATSLSGFELFIGSATLSRLHR